MYGYSGGPSLFGLLGAISNLICTGFWILLLAVVVLFILKIFMVNKYAEETVVERWGALLPSLAGKAETYLPRVEEALKTRAPSFGFHRERIATSLTSSDYQDFSVCQMSADYSSFASCLAVGSDLHVSWLIQDHMIKGIYRVPVLGPLLLSVMKRYSFAQTNKVRAFASVTYSCAVEAAEQLLAEANQDVSRLNRKTSGKLGPL